MELESTKIVSIHFTFPFNLSHRENNLKFQSFSKKGKGAIIVKPLGK
jgi:hypothetical protein